MDDMVVVEMPEAGEGVTLEFTNKDIRSLFNTFGKRYNEIIVTGLLLFDLEIVDACLKVGAKKDGKPVVVKFDELKGTTIEKLQLKILDAYHLCLTGRTYMDQMEYLEQEEKKRQAKDGPQPPQKSLEASSVSSEELLSGPGSAPPSSGA